MTDAETKENLPVEAKAASKSSLESNIGSQPIQNDAPTQINGSIESTATPGPTSNPLYGKQYAAALLT
jgi:hypothetical protein